MRLLHGLVVAVAVLMCADAGTRADEPLRIAGATIPKVFEPGKGGPYNAFFKDVVAEGPVDVKLVMLPVKRLARSFFDRQVDCMYMATDDPRFYIRHGIPMDTLEVSIPFSKIYLLAFTRDKASVVSDWQALEGQAMAADEGIHASTIVQRTLPFAKEILYTKTIDEAFEILAADRVKVTLAFDIDAHQYFKRTGNTGFHADYDFPLLTLGEGVACWPSDDARNLVAHLNEEIETLRESGELKNRYGFDLRD